MNGWGQYNQPLEKENFPYGNSHPPGDVASASPNGQRLYDIVCPTVWAMDKTKVTLGRINKHVDMPWDRVLADGRCTQETGTDLVKLARTERKSKRRD